MYVSVGICASLDRSAISTLGGGEGRGRGRGRGGGGGPTAAVHLARLGIHGSSVKRRENILGMKLER